MRILHQKLKSCVLGLEFFGTKISAKKARIKCLRNWVQTWKQLRWLFSGLQGFTTKDEQVVNKIEPYSFISKKPLNVIMPKSDHFERLTTITIDFYLVKETFEMFSNQTTGNINQWLN